MCNNQRFLAVADPLLPNPTGSRSTAVGSTEGIPEVNLWLTNAVSKSLQRCFSVILHLRRTGRVAGAVAILALGSASLVAATAQSAGAQNTDTVTNCSGSVASAGSLPYEVANASAGDTIVFASGLSCTGASTVVLAAPITISQDLTIVGPGAQSFAVSGDDSVQDFFIGSEILGPPSSPLPTATISGMTIEDGTALSGGGVAVEGAAASLSDVVIEGNVATGNATYSPAQVPDSGGGLSALFYGHASLVDSAVYGNSAGVGGGIAASEDGYVNISSTTVTDNSSSSEGGGIYGGLDSGLNIAASTIADNSAADSGFDAGGGVFTYGQTTYGESLFSGNTGGNCSLGAYYLPDEDYGYNLDDDGTCTYQATDVAGPAGLDPSGLLDNGGPTPTIALEPGSAAIGSVPLAHCPSTDQRGAPPVPTATACDSGAYDSGVPPFIEPVQITVSGSTDLAGTATTYSYTSNAPPGVTFSGYVQCVGTVNGGMPPSDLGSGRYTVDGPGCWGLTSSNAAYPVFSSYPSFSDFAVSSYVGAPDGFLVTGAQVPTVAVLPQGSLPAEAGMVTYQVVVTGVASMPTGSVTITDGTGGTCSPLMPTSVALTAMASCSELEGGTGPYVVIASYSGDTTYASVQSSITVNADDASSGTASLATPDGVTVAASGGPDTDTSDAVTETQYSVDPVLPLQDSDGSFFDVAVTQPSGFTTVTVTDCNPDVTPASSLQWYDTDSNPAAWTDVSPGGYDPLTRCLVYNLNDDAPGTPGASAPTISQLDQTVFGAVTPPGLTITTSSLPTGDLLVPYAATLSAVLGATPYKWSLASGTLPTGLKLSSTGAISGTPKAIGISDFTIKVTDSKSPGAAATSATAALSITVGQPAPTISAVAPASGPGAGGNKVIITGTGLENAQAVDFGSLPAVVLEDGATGTSITASAPAHHAGQVDLTVTTPGGVAGFSYNYLAPIVTAVKATSGPGAGGQKVTISGSDFNGATLVEFGNDASSTITVNSSGSVITALAPREAAGTVNVVVTTPGGSSAISSADNYTYLGPSITKVSPTSGPVAGGTKVTLSGADFQGLESVEFGNVRRDKPGRQLGRHHDHGRRTGRFARSGEHHCDDARRSRRR